MTRSYIKLPTVERSKTVCKFEVPIVKQAGIFNNGVLPTQHTHLSLLGTSRSRRKRHYVHYSTAREVFEEEGLVSM